jgi:transposase
VSDQLDQERPPSRTCDRCGSPMSIMATLPSTSFRFPQRIYKCPVCKFTAAETDTRGR